MLRHVYNKNVNDDHTNENEAIIRVYRLQSNFALPANITTEMSDINLHAVISECVCECVSTSAATEVGIDFEDTAETISILPYLL